MSPRKLFAFFALCLPACSILQAQKGNFPLNPQFYYAQEKAIYLADSTFTAFKSLLLNSQPFLEDSTNSFMSRNLLEAQSEKMDFHLNPLLHYQLFQGDDASFQGFGLGVSSRFSLLNKLSAGIDYAHFSVEYPTYQQDLIEQTGAIPSMGFASFDGSAVKSNYLNAYIDYAPSKVFDFQLGYGRNFIGDGYRSLLLSDYSGSYPYLRINTQIWKLKYTNLFTVQENNFSLSMPAGGDVEKTSARLKYTATHFLDFQATDWLTVGLFETIVWQRQDTIFRRGYDVNYLNPVIFYRPLEFSTGSADNVLIGVNLKARVAKKHILYSQMIIDEMLVAEMRADIKQFLKPKEDIQSHWWANKYALQLGLHSFNVFGIEGLESRLEYNFVRPYMYSHASPDQSYSHKNRSLAHPLGANFQEALLHLDYHKNKWRFHFNYHFSKGGKSIDTLNFGENILITNHSRAKDYEVFTGQGAAFETHYLNTGLSYMLQPKWGMYLQLAYLHHSQEMYSSSSENYLMLKLSTALFSQYFDY